MNDENVKRLIEKLPTIEDSELRFLISNLIGERSELLKHSKIDYLTGVYNRKKNR